MKHEGIEKMKHNWILNSMQGDSRHIVAKQRLDMLENLLLSLAQREGSALLSEEVYGSCLFLRVYIETMKEGGR